MNITSKLFEAYLRCPTKCFLAAQGEAGRGNTYTDWLQVREESYRREGIMRLRGGAAEEGGDIVLPCTEGTPSANGRFTADSVVRAHNLESRPHIVERVPPKNRGRPVRLIPIRFVPTNKITRHDKLLLAFDGVVLSEMLRCEIGPGRIIHGDDQLIVTVKLSPLVSEVRTLTRKIAALLSNQSPPDLVLNRHCAECEYQGRCRQKAVEKDDLSLLAGMTEKERKKHNSKGIFTVTQLSHTFRPRRRPKRLASRGEKYHHALKALAIRERKVHVVGNPELKLDGTPVYLDVEGLPDRDFYFLIGVRIPTDDGLAQHSFWADNPEDEKRIWDAFLGLLATVESPRLIHYGSFETTFLKKLLGRYGDSGNAVVGKAIECPVNLLSFVYAHIYFPTYSNGLKDLARFVGFDWSDPNAAGAQAVVWRAEWEQSHEPALKQKLVEYNADDCEGLRRVTDFVRTLSTPPGVTPDGAAADVVRTESLRRETPCIFGRVQFRLPELEAINRAAYWDYQRQKVLVKSSARLQRIAEKSRKRRRVKPRVNKTVRWPAPVRCPKCGGARLWKHAAASKTVLDVKFGSSSIKRWVTKYLFSRYQCSKCGAIFYNPARAWGGEKSGPNLRALSVYQNIELRMPQERVAAFLNQVLTFSLPRTAINRFKANAAAFYKGTYDGLVRRVVTGHLVHADETKVSLKAGIGYVWAFTNLEEVVYVYAPSREGDLVHSLLKDFRGVLVSDFYTAYESLECPQQRCLIHLIRDLNDDLLKEPFNEEMKEIVGEFAGLLKPMVETVDHFGLKARFLRKHKVCADRFFRRLAQRDYHTETALKCKNRLEKNRGSLFTFLDYDGVPWNNNNAEHAIKAFALLRRDFSGVSTQKGIREYLILLSICETCRFRGVSFLDFLRSGEKDIDAFADSQRGRRKRS
jgi:predicted RecB family nuclease